MTRPGAGRAERCRRRAERCRRRRARSLLKATCVQSKRWAAKPTRKRKATEPDVPKGAGDWTSSDALAKVYDLSLIPNQLVTLVWYCDLVMQPHPVVRCVSPARCLAKTIDFAENHIFRFA